MGQRPQTGLQAESYTPVYEMEHARSYNCSLSDKDKWERGITGPQDWDPRHQVVKGMGQKHRTGLATTYSRAAIDTNAMLCP